MNTGLTVAAYTLGMTNFDQSQHPRNAAGTSKGGQFAQKQNSAPEAGLNAAPLSPEDAWRAAMAREAQLERELEAAQLAKVRAGAVVIASLVREHYPLAVDARFRTFSDWDTPEGERSVAWEGAFDADGNLLVSGEDLAELPINKHGYPLDGYTHDFIGYEIDPWEREFEIAGDGYLDLDGNGTFIIRFDRV